MRKEETAFMSHKIYTKPVTIRVLVVDDDCEVRAQVSNILAHLDWEITQCSDDDTAMKLAATGQFQLLILDRMLGVGGRDALSLLPRLAEAEVAIATVVLSSLGGSIERSTGFESGADLYLEKPVNERELVAACKSAVRRFGRGASSPSLTLAGKLILRNYSKTAFWDGDEIVLRPQSFKLLQILVQNHGRCVSREEIWRQVWPDWRGAPVPMLLEQGISKLRRDLHSIGLPPIIKTHRMQGYSIILDRLG